MDGRLASQRYINLTLAARNLLRYPLRSGVTLCAIALSLGAYLFVDSFMQGYQAQVVDKATGWVTGDIQIQHADFRAEMKPSLAFAVAPEWLSRIRDLPAVQAVSTRVQSAAVLSSAARTEPITLVGIDPAREVDVTTLHRSIRVGRNLQGGRDIVIGHKLAERLNVHVGERIVVTLQHVAGELAAEAFVVAGVFRTGDDELDRNVAHAVLPKVQSMLGLGERVTSVAIRLRSRDDMSQALPVLRAGLPSEELRALSWEALLPEIVNINEIIGGGIVLVGATVFLVVAMVVMNTVLMSVFERAREFGTLLAIGANPLLVTRLVALESVLLALGGIAVALALGGTTAWSLSVSGLRLEAGSGIASVSGVVFPAVSGTSLLVPSLAVFAVVLLAAIYPALKISRLDPVRAIRHV